MLQEIVKENRKLLNKLIKNMADEQIVETPSEAEAPVEEATETPAQ